MHTYRNYMADMSFYAVNNISSIGGGIEVKKKFFEILERKPKDSRTAEEIINDIKSKLNGENNESV